MKKLLLRLGLVLGILLVLSTSIYALDWLGVVDVRSKVYEVPVINKLMPVTKTATEKETTSKPNPLAKENTQLKNTNAKLQKQVTELQGDIKDLNNKQKAMAGEKETLIAEVAKLQVSLEDANKVEEEEQVRSQSFEQLARYYGAMKAKEAVKSLSQLDDDTVIGILTKLEDDQAAAILANLEPDRAAKIVRNMASQ